MTLARAAAAILSAGLLSALGACSSDAPEDDQDSAADPSTSASPDETTAEQTSEPDDVPAAGSPAEIASSCEAFNAIMVDLRGIADGDSHAFGDVYTMAQDARDDAPLETYDLFSAVSLLALDRSLGETNQDTADRLRDAAFASSRPCTEQGVTITL